MAAAGEPTLNLAGGLPKSDGKAENPPTLPCPQTNPPDTPAPAETVAWRSSS